MLVYSHNLIGKTIHKYILDNLGFRLELRDLRYGCMKPDFAPKLIAIPHYKNESFEIISDMILALQNTPLPVNSKQLKHFSAELGVVLHYITDYFCYPHNNKRIDKMPVHFFYELNLDRELRKYVSSPLEVINNNLDLKAYNNINVSIIDFIELKHRQYMKECPSLLNDVVYGLQCCYVVAIGIINSLIIQGSHEAA
ncbi:zinc dependent phospholipase C family protein [Candidatus Clostridium radicumherbarum]|uniref:Zinc dependent phospholipase C family protein n=1 Tax=Candidatus Clostridium radicumherbarum TaxID=3381662 RepID=A0ABW8TX76_9CLOT